ncbi:L,D-transpeptidase [Fuscovulum blasticum DSM 2131]|uniref:L,D-transpeptidase n=1 Tax=Fuscovulum blasticum DSM 2131 TaxID=1188250 RepID=A0A2T4J9I9_FUSBL|nr:L,D-transpeptidase [Fuscovulum blasticum]AWD21751.1 hypothetical protein B6K69_08735 [Fuscovulum blasticum]PTE14576.1 L,D-transpeptidase [Fuscovulum blasticum DSM 2131]
MTFSLARLAAILALPLLAACGGPRPADTPPGTLPGYEAVQDGEFLIPAVERKDLIEGNVRTEVDYAGDEKPGTIVVDIFARKLYWVMEGGRAVRYGIAVGREGLSFKGNGYIGRKREWPSWQPTANMLRTRPDMYGDYAAGLPGGLNNPLGARALYLYRGGRDTMFRIHGTIENASIGRATSAGCIRLFNQDAIDLYERVDTGARVKVRTLDESVALEGPMMDDAYGRVVPATPENMAKKEKDAAAVAAYEAREAERKAKEAEAARIAAEKADKKRLRACKSKGIAPEDCPPLETTVSG